MKVEIQASHISELCKLQSEQQKSKIFNQSKSSIYDLSMHVKAGIKHTRVINMGTKKIEGIYLDMSKTRDIYLGRHAFVNMHRLRFLKFYSSRYEEDIDKNLLENFISPAAPISRYCLRSRLIEELYLDETAIEELPSFIEYLSRLVLLDVKSCSRLKSLPNNICNWKSLKRLNLSDCSQLESLRNEIGSLESLMELEAEGTAIREVPAIIKCLNNLNMLSFRRYYTDQETVAIINLSNLSELNICNCERLQHLPVLPLISIDAHGCTSLEALSCLSIVGTIVSKDQPFIFVNFANSVKLDWNVRKDILEDALLQMQHLATLWKQKYYDNRRNLKRDMMPRACICNPRSEVRDWFHYQNKGSFINVELPRNWFSPNLVGFALCVVVAFRDHQDYDWVLVIHFECKYQCVPDSTLASNTSTCGLPCYINSDHVFMGFDFHLYPSNHIGESCQNNEVSFQFYLKRLYDGNKIECCKITECGVRLMYAQGLGKSNGSVSSCKEIDEPCSKRCKYP
ncbi:hypothetical protein EZV62_019036 [Acer yangbiense]|uniref:C-JID domain-containing protein n=1 Tax=Acer yangbiense TaxID=1000413 RepID=A0A5C7H9R5_9ROSI|nr:hypothetical protein EZV62_019036 [Acer yangbiense]